jgi:hypothetical protein
VRQQAEAAAKAQQLAQAETAKQAQAKAAQQAAVRQQAEAAAKAQQQADAKATKKDATPPQQGHHPGHREETDQKQKKGDGSQDGGPPKPG